MDDHQAFRRHELSKKTKLAVFVALFERQQGRCFICGVSQAELEARWQAEVESWWIAAKEYPEEHWIHQAYLKRRERQHPAHTKLYIDHCHQTGYIRGLLCNRCNDWLGGLERYAFREKPDGISEEDFAKYCEEYASWLGEHMPAILAYMQPDRWLPRTDILFHLHAEL